MLVAFPKPLLIPLQPSKGRNVAYNVTPNSKIPTLSPLWIEQEKMRTFLI